MMPKVLENYNDTIQLALAICLLSSRNGIIRTTHAMVPKNVYRKLRTENIIGKSETARILRAPVIRDLEPFREELVEWLKTPENVEKQNQYREAYRRETLGTRKLGGSRPGFGERFLPRH